MTDGHIYALIICSTILALLALIAVASYFSSKDKDDE